MIIMGFIDESYDGDHTIVWLVLVVDNIIDFIVLTIYDFEHNINVII